MKLRVEYVVKISKEVRRMVNWKKGKDGLAELPEVAQEYRELGTSLMEAQLKEWHSSGKAKMERDVEHILDSEAKR